MRRISAAEAKSIAKSGRYRAGETLFLNVAPGGSKSWVQRLTIDGRRRDIGLGGYPLVSLAEAREAALENRKLARTGGDPLAEKRRRRTPTFREAANAVHEANKPRWRNNHHIASWMQTLERHAFPILGDMAVDRIGREDVLGVLAPIWGEKQETARRVRQRIRTVLRWSQAHGYVEHNAAGEAIDGALPAMPAVRQHLRALPYTDVPEALRLVEASNASRGGAARVQVSDIDREPAGRGSGRDLGRGRHRRAGVADTGFAHEGRERASPAAIGRGDGCAGTGAGASGTGAAWCFRRLRGRVAR